jgi:hypothetical protein
MSAEAAITRSWPVGPYMVTLSAPKPKPGQQLAAAIEWAPSLPKSRLTVAEIAQYRAGRDAAIVDIARELGIRVAVVEV